MCALDAVDGSTTWHANNLGSVAKEALKARLPVLALLRHRALAAACPLIVPERTYNQQCPHFRTIGLLAEAEPTCPECYTWSPVDPEQTFGLIDSWPSF